jgi:hypothetical protein
VFPSTNQSDSTCIRRMGRLRKQVAMDMP